MDAAGGPSRPARPPRPWMETTIPAALAVLLVALLLGIQPQILTGDEARYLLYSLSFLRDGTFTMPVAEWSAHHRLITGSPMADLPRGGEGAAVMNPVYLPALLSPLTAFAPLGSLRLATLIAGLGGLFCLHRLIREELGAWPALAAAGIAAFSIPLLPYLHLFYMESWVFALVCLGWWRLRRAGTALRADALTAGLLATIPIIHMRGSVVAATLYLLLLLPRMCRREWRSLVLLVIPGTLGLAALVALNLGIYGTVTGPVNSARPPSPLAWAEVLPMQLFNVRHGLLAYAPIWILGYAGLVAASWQGSRMARQGLLLAAVAAVTGVGVNPGECWPARFWVLSIPMLALGLGHWIRAERGIAMRIPSAVLLAITLANSVLFFTEPNTFIENRQTTLTYQRLFDLGLPFHFGLLLPVELQGDARQADRAAGFALGFGLLLAVASFAMLRPGGWRALPLILIVGAGLDLSRARAHPAPAMLSRPTENGFVVTLHPPAPVAILQFGRPWQAWAHVPHQMDVATRREDGTAARGWMTLNQIVPLRCGPAIAEIRIVSPGFPGLADQAGYRLRLYRPVSLLHELANGFGVGCGIAAPE